MKIKINLADMGQCKIALSAIIGVYPQLSLGQPKPAAHVTAVPFPVALASEPADGFPLATPRSSESAPALATSEPAPAPVAASETPETVSKLDELIAGRALTKSVKVADGPQMKVGDEVYTRDGTLLVIEATVRGTAICIDEAGVLHEVPSGLLVADKASLQPVTETAPETPAAAPVTIVQDDALAEDEAAAGDLPSDYLLAELHEAGNLVKRHHSVAKVLSLLGEVSPGTVRLTDMAVGKRADLLAKFNAAIAA